MASAAESRYTLILQKFSDIDEFPLIKKGEIFDISPLNLIIVHYFLLIRVPKNTRGLSVDIPLRRYIC